MTFDNYRSIFSYSMTRKAFYNTLILVFSSATLTMVLSSVVSWFSVRRRSVASRWLNVLAFFPLAIPNMVNRATMTKSPLKPLKNMGAMRVTI